VAESAIKYDAVHWPDEHAVRLIAEMTLIHLRCSPKTLPGLDAVIS